MTKPIWPDPERLDPFKIEDFIGRGGVMRDPHLYTDDAVPLPLPRIWCILAIITAALAAWGLLWGLYLLWLSRGRCGARDTVADLMTKELIR